MKPSFLITLATSLVVLSMTQAFAHTPAGWTDNYAKALEKAKAENKHVLLDFTGSDWCPWCIKLDKEIFAKAEFKSFAKDNLVLVTLDFPNSPLPKKTKDQNDKLKGKFGAKGFPTLVIVDAEGKEVWKHVGYIEGGPPAFIKEVSGVLKTKG